jgi:uncharacterized protein YkwD
VTRLATTLALAASIGASAALSVPAEAARHAPHASAGCRASKAHARSKRSCTTAAHHTTASGRRASEHKQTLSKTRASERVSPPPKLASVAAGAKASRAATIAKILVTPCQNTELTPEWANLAAARAAVLCLVNVERAQHDLEPLAANAQLEAAAESHGREMIAADYFNHVSPSGLTPVDRVRQTGYLPNPEVGYVIGENLAWGTLSLSTPASIVAAWVASPEHLANILETKYRETGIDVEPEAPAALAEGAQGALYTQEFGVIIR